MAKKKELRKKEEQRKRELKESLNYNESVKHIALNLVSVVAVFVLFYFVTTLISKQNGLHEKEPDNTPVEIQYKEILAGETFNMPDDEYYVLFYDFDGSNADYYKTIASQSEKKVYTVDLGNALNTYAVSESTNSNIQNAPDLKVKEATLIKVKNKRNVYYFEGKLKDIKENIK